MPLPNGGSPFSEEYKGLVREHVRQVIARAKQKGWYRPPGVPRARRRAPTAEQYERVRRWVRSSRKSIPRAWSPSPASRLRRIPPGVCSSTVNGWISNGNFLFSGAAAIEDRRQTGDWVAWYISCDQLYPMPNYFIDREAADPRMRRITRRYRHQGILYSDPDLLGRGEGPSDRPGQLEIGTRGLPAAGEGSLLWILGNMARKYTGQDDVDGPIGSIRLELLRKGLEELELLRLLDAAGGESAKPTRSWPPSAAAFAISPATRTPSTTRGNASSRNSSNESEVCKWRSSGTAGGRRQVQPDLHLDSNRKRPHRPCGGPRGGVCSLRFDARLRLTPAALPPRRGRGKLVGTHEDVLRPERPPAFPPAAGLHRPVRQRHLEESRTLAGSELPDLVADCCRGPR